MSKKKLLGIQRRMGLLLTILSVLTAIIFGGDLTCMLVLIPLGLYMLCTKKVIIYHEK